MYSLDTLSPPVPNGDIKKYMQVFAWQPLLVCPCHVYVYRRNLLLSSSLLLRQCPVYFARLTWMVSGMVGVLVSSAVSSIFCSSNLNDQWDDRCPCFFGSVQYILLVLLKWSVGWQVSLLLWQCPVYFARLAWMVSEMTGVLASLAVSSIFCSSCLNGQWDDRCPCFSGSVQYILLVLLEWSVR